MIMNCAHHPDASAVAYCRECGKPMCADCRRLALGSVYCAEHLPVAEPAATSSFLPPPPVHSAPPLPGETSSPYTAPAYLPPPDHGPNPGLAFGLGFIPGVGAIYNGQYAKGLIHAVVFGLLVSLADNVRGSLEPLAGIGIAVWVFYMAFEAYHTARKRRYGVAVEEFSSLIDVRSTQGGRFPAGAVVLIALGVILLLDTTGIIAMDEMERYWPVGLIVFGVYLLFVRMNAASRHSGDNAGDGTEVRR